MRTKPVSGHLAPDQCDKQVPMQLHRLLRPLGLVVFSLLLVCRANADLYVSAIGVVSSGVARFNEAPPGLVRTFASNLGPTGLAFGPDGNLYVAVQPGAFGYEVVRFDRSGNPINVFVQPLIGANISDLTFGPDGNLYVALFGGTGDGEILRFNGRTGAPMNTFASTFPSPGFMTFGPDRNLYISSQSCFCVERVSATTGQVSTLIPKFQGVPAGIRFGPRGLYVIDNVDLTGPTGIIHVAQVEVYDLTGKRVGTFIPAVINGKLGAATDLAFGHDGNLYILERDSGEIVRFNGTTGALIGTGVFATVPGVPSPTPLYMAFSTPLPGGATDFNGDGHPDLALVNPATGQTAERFLSNNITISGALVRTLPAGWRLVDVADYDADGRGDFWLFNPTTRQTVIWHLVGPTLIYGVYGPTLPPGWQLAAVGDFNGDNHPDLVLVNPSTLQTAIWYLNRNVLVSGGLGPTLPPGWRIVGAVNFDHNVSADYLLFNPGTHQSAIWYFSGRTRIAAKLGPTLPPGWILSGAADFDRNGTIDYLLFNPFNRQTAIWYLDGFAQFVTSRAGPTLPIGWTLTAP